MSKENEIAQCYYCGQSHPKVSMLSKFIEISSDQMQLCYFCSAEHLALVRDALIVVHCIACGVRGVRDDMTEVEFAVSAVGTKGESNVGEEKPLMMTVHFCGADDCREIAEIFQVMAVYSKRTPITREQLTELRAEILRRLNLLQ